LVDGGAIAESLANSIPESSKKPSPLTSDAPMSGQDALSTPALGAPAGIAGIAPTAVLKV